MMLDSEILEDLKRVSSELGTAAVPIREYTRLGKFAQTTVKKRFGSWNRALAAAGLNVTAVHELADAELFDNLREVWIKLGRQPRKREMARPLSRFTHSPYVRRFGSWLSAMRRFAEITEETTAEEFAGSETGAGRGPREPSLRLRFLVMRRDRFKCVVCGRSPASDTSVLLHVDHTLAWSRGGRTTLENLRTTCLQCNLGKSNLAPETA